MLVLSLPKAIIEVRARTDQIVTGNERCVLLPTPLPPLPLRSTRRWPSRLRQPRQRPSFNPPPPRRHRSTISASGLCPHPSSPQAAISPCTRLRLDLRPSVPLRRRTSADRPHPPTPPTDGQTKHRPPAPHNRWLELRSVARQTTTMAPVVRCQPCSEDVRWNAAMEMHSARRRPLRIG